MENVKLKAILEGLTAADGPVKVGATFTTNAASADALVREGWATIEGDNSQKDQDPAGGQPGAPDGGQSTNDPDEEELERIRQALDDQYTAPELAKAAKEAGVEFKYDAKKGEIVQAVIDQGKASDVLK